MSSETDAAVDAPHPTPDPADATAIAEPGRTLADRYRLGRCVAVGGMGSVWEAEDLRLGRWVAVKVPADHLTRTVPDLEERFAREATAAARLAHPHVAVVHDHGHEGETPFIVMELLRGETLADRLARGPVPPEEAARIAGQVAGALDAAHAEGIVHRDVKPSNIMLTADGVKVMDFGVASADWTHTITTAGVIGTAAYLSPEQAGGEKAVAASDVYSLGVVVYEMLAGRRPFEADTPVAVVASHVHRDPPPLEETAPDVPEHMARAVALALSKDPADRPSTATELARMLADPDEVFDPDATAVDLDTPDRVDDDGGPTQLLAAPAVTEALDIDDDSPTAVYPVASATSSDEDPRRRWAWVVAVAGLVLVAIASWALADGGEVEQPPVAPITETTAVTVEPEVATSAPPTVDAGATEEPGPKGNQGGNGGGKGNGNGKGNGKGG